MIVKYDIELEDKEITAIHELTKINCEGVRCTNCPLFMVDMGHCIRYYAQKANYHLQERGIEIWRH